LNAAIALFQAVQFCAATDRHPFQSTNGQKQWRLKMNEVAYFKIRARHFSERAIETLDPNLKSAYAAIALDMAAKLKTADKTRTVILVDGIAIGEPSVQPWLVATE
jgi:hypothetical protein